MSEEYPLFPELSEQGAQEAQKLMDAFKSRAKETLSELLDEVCGDLYTDIIPHIGSDSWINYRNDLMGGFKNYDNRRFQGEWDFKEIRQEIYKEFKGDIIADLNQDNIDKIADLEKRLEYFQCR